jgi:hypothetical protein
VQDGNRIYTNIFAACRLLLYSPVFWLLATAMLASLEWLPAWLHLPAGFAPVARRVLATAGLLVVVPAFWGRRAAPALSVGQLAPRPIP